MDERSARRTHEALINDGSLKSVRSLSASKPWMRADIHYGPERDEAPLQWSDTLMQRLTFDQLRYVACDTRPDHTFDLCCRVADGAGCVSLRQRQSHYMSAITSSGHAVRKSQPMLNFRLGSWLLRNSRLSHGQCDGAAVAPSFVSFFADRPPNGREGDPNDHPGARWRDQAQKFPDRGDQRRYPDNVHHAGQIVGQDGKRHLGLHVV